MDKSRIVALVVLAGIGTACARTSEPGETAGAPAPAPVAGATASARTADDLGIDLGDPRLVLGAPVHTANLIAWPILAEVPDAPPTEEQAEFLTLDAALDSGAARVLETGDVNELALENTSDKPIFVLAGEVLQGGRQDRIIGRDLVIAPGEKAPLASFCVEQGRWSAHADDPDKGAHFGSAKALANAPVRFAAQVEADQGRVWANTAAVNASLAATPETGTYLASLEKAEGNAEVDEIAGRILEALGRARGVRGLVVAVDPDAEGELICAEVFGGEALYRSLEAKLVRAYALDAVTRSAAHELEKEQPDGAQLLGQTPSQQMRVGTPDLGVNFRSLGFSTHLMDESGHSPSLAEPPAGELTASTPGLEHLHRTIYRKR